MQAVERAAANQGFHRAAIDDALVDAITKIEQIAVCAAALALLHDFKNGRFARAFYRAEAVTNRFVAGRNETITAQIDIGRQHVQFICDSIFVQRLHFVGIVHRRA